MSIFKKVGSVIAKVANPVKTIGTAIIPANSNVAKLSAKINTMAKPAVVSKILANPITAIVKAAAPQSALAKAATKMEANLTKANPANVLVDVNKSLAAASLNVADRILTGNKTTKGFSSAGGIGGKSFLASKLNKSVDSGDKWMTTSKAGKITVGVGSAVAAVVGTVIPVVGVAEAALGAGLTARNAVVDKQNLKRIEKGISNGSVVGIDQSGNPIFASASTQSLASAGQAEAILNQGVGSTFIQKVIAWLIK